MKKFIILDRDGVINYDSDAYIKSPAEWLPLPGSLAAIARLKKAGFKIAIASNQSGLAHKLYDEHTLDLMHQKMQTLLAEHSGSIDLIRYCPHLAADACACRKPKPGLLYQIATAFNITLDNVYFIGDKQSDLDAATAAGCKTALVKTGYGLHTLEENPALNVPVYADLAAFTEALLTEAISVA